MVELAVGAQIFSLHKGTDLVLKIGKWKPNVQLHNYCKHKKHAFGYYYCILPLKVTISAPMEIPV